MTLLFRSDSFGSCTNSGRDEGSLSQDDTE
jgi:hypothetical protein